MPLLSTVYMKMIGDSSELLVEFYTLTCILLNFSSGVHS